MDTTESTYEVLVFAMQRDDVESFRSFLKRRNLPKDSTWHDYELLVKAIKLGQKRFVKILLEYGVRVFKCQGRTSPLHLVVTKIGWYNIVQMLLENGARVKHQDSQGNTPLHLAFTSVDVQGHVIDMLLKYHLKYSNKIVSNHEWLNFLHIACARNNVDVVEKLVKANIAAIDSRVRTHIPPSPLYAGYTPLRFAVEFGRYEVVKFLLKNGANILVSDAERSTPLHYAFKKRDYKMVNTILAHAKARYDWEDDTGITYFMLACTGSDTAIVEDQLKLADAKPWTKSSYLLNKCVSNAGTYAGYTPLHFAIEFGNIKTIETLLDYKADCCTANSVGLTAHDLASKCREQFVCDLLSVYCKIRRGVQQNETEKS